MGERVGHTFALTDEQEAAVELVVDRAPPVACLTGGPGTGKTSTIKELLRRLTSQGRSYALAAPSGKAAARLAEATGAQAKTIHRLLYLKPGEKPRPEPLGAEVVVVDEASMIDVPLMAHLCHAAFEGGGQVRTLLLVGDAEQLPPVGPGSPFHDLLSSGAVPTVRLTQVQRQAAESGIVRAAYAIRDGKAPEWGEDFRLAVEPDAERIPARVLAVAQELQMDVERSQVLAPQNTGGAGVKSLCAFLERARGGEELGALLRDRYRVGTKVIATKNDYGRMVFNGEQGWVEAVEEGPGGKRGKDRMLVRIAGQEHEYRGEEIKNNLMPAWALTVHRSQGSEWPDVVFVAHRSHTHMLTRSLLYVAVTRARDRVVVVGTQDAVDRAVKTVRDLKRRTNLQRWLAQEAAA